MSCSHKDSSTGSASWCSPFFTRLLLLQLLLLLLLIITRLIPIVGSGRSTGSSYAGLLSAQPPSGNPIRYRSSLLRDFNCRISSSISHVKASSNPSRRPLYASNTSSTETSNMGLEPSAASSGAETPATSGSPNSIF